MIYKVSILCFLAVLNLVNARDEGFQAANKALARQLDSQKFGLAIGSPCPQQFNRDGAVLCAANQLARCNGGLISGPLQDCAASLNCQVLPLVNSPGITVTCDTDADKNTRIGDVGVTTPQTDQVTSNAPPVNKVDDTVKPVQSNIPIGKAGFQAANKGLARQLDGQKMGLSLGSPCPQQFNRDGSVLCVGNQLGRCTGGLVSGPVQSCAGGLNCQVLPLVNSPGVSVTCDTDADKLARIGDAGNSESSDAKIPTTPTTPPQPSSNAATTDKGGFQAANKALARQLDGQKMGLSLGSPCPQQLNVDGSVLCVGNQLGRCSGGLVSGPLQSCAGGLNCQVLPLVNSRGISVTCDTDADKNTRING